MKINIIKAHGTQNHFIIIYDKKNDPYLKKKETIQKLCQSANSKRIDGLLLLSDENQYDFKMDYYNNDGTWETMCANGARCAALYMHQYQNKNTKLKFLAGDGLHQADIITDNHVRLKMSPPKYCSKEIKLFDVSGFHIDSGATHFAIEYPGISNQEVKELGSKIRYDDIFKPRGINVNFYERINSNEINVKTYEKGIEDLMMSCGSGSVACAYHLAQNNSIESPTKINILGGELEVHFNNTWNDVWLSGPAHIEYQTEINI